MSVCDNSNTDAKDKQENASKNISADFEKQISHKLVESIMNLMPISVYINNLSPFKPHWISGRLFEDTGYTKEEWENFTSEEFFTLFEWPSYQYYVDSYQRVMSASDGEIFESEYRMRCKNGSWIDVFSRGVVFNRDNSGKPKQLLCAALNVSSIKSAYKQLKENKSRYKTFFENSPENIIIFDCDFHVLDANLAMLNFSGYSKEELQGHYVLDFVQAGIHSDLLVKLGPLIRANGFKYQYQSEFLNKKQQRFFIDITHWPVYNEQNEIVATVAKIKDITEQTNRENQILAENQSLKKELSSVAIQRPEMFEKIITRDRCMQNIFKYMEAISKNSEYLFITGETGTGKELIAETYYKLSGLKGKFVTVNVASLDEQMFADTLFGHKKGAFTGADSDFKGLVETANNGVLFLDEIGDLSMASQIKLLRLLQNKEYYRLGSDEIKTTNARIVTATNHNLNNLVGENRFRADLLYRLTVHTINLPPLRERFGDLPLLVDYYITQICKSHNRKTLPVSAEALNLLVTYDFPGNIRELRNMLFDAFNTCATNIINTDYFYHYIRLNTKDRDAIKSASKALSFPQILPSFDQIKELLIDEALKRSNGNISKAAQLLSMERSALSKAIKRFKVQIF